jgi:hypothetical protein
MKVVATLNVNGTDYPVEIDPHLSLLRAVSDEIGLTGSKEGCDDSECGACMMLLDGRPVNSCSYLALQAEGREISTVEGLAGAEGLAPFSGPCSSRAACRVGSAPWGCWSCPPRCWARIPTRARTRSASRSPATSAGARAATASCVQYAAWLRP